jgi:hypothetical protein
MPLGACIGFRHFNKLKARFFCPRKASRPGPLESRRHADLDYAGTEMQSAADRRAWAGKF